MNEVATCGPREQDRARWIRRGLGLAVLVLLAGAPAVSAAQDVFIVLGKGAEIPVAFEPFCLPDIENGATPVARVADDVVVSSRLLVEQGAELTVEVVSYESNGWFDSPGKLELQLVSVPAVDGTRVELGGDNATLVLEPGGHNVFVKLITLFLVRGKDPCAGETDIVPVEAAKDYQIVVSQD